MKNINTKCVLIAIIAYMVLLMVVVTSGVAGGSSDIVSMLLVLVAVGVYKLCAAHEVQESQEDNTGNSSVTTTDNWLKRPGVLRARKILGYLLIIWAIGVPLFTYYLRNQVESNMVRLGIPQQIECDKLNAQNGIPQGTPCHNVPREK